MHVNPEIAQNLGETVCVILGFCIFFWVLKKFAWGPVLQTLDDRQAKIRGEFDEIKRMQAQTAETQKQYEAKLREIEAEARTHIQAAVADGQRVAAEITEKAREDAAQITENATKRMDIALATARKEFREEVIRLTFAATEKLIRARLDESRDRELVSSFISEMENRS